MNLKPHIFIFSVFQSDLVWSVNRNNHVETLEILKSMGIPCTELRGKYNGVSELSILVQGDTKQNLDLVKSAVLQFNQECYLESHSDRATFLVYKSGKKEFIGTLKPVSEAEATAKGSYSYEPETNQYFITE